MHIINVNWGCIGQLAMRLAPRATGLVGRQTLTRVLRHRIDIRIQWQALLQHKQSVGIMRTKNDRRQLPRLLLYHSNRLIAAGSKPVLDTRNYRFLHPLDIVINSRHRLTKADEQSHVGILLDEGGNALARIVGNEWRDRSVSVLCLQPVVVGKGLA